MAKITKAHIRAAQARKKILISQNKNVPAKIEKLAGLNIRHFPTKVDAGVAPKVLRRHGKGAGFMALLMHHGKSTEPEVVVDGVEVKDRASW